MFLWAFLPPFVLSFFEKMALGTTGFSDFVKNRLMGVDRAFVFVPRGHSGSVTQLTPGRFLASPGLWLGLVFAALCIAAAVQLRRSREPV